MATIDLMDRFGNLGSGGIRNNGTLDDEALFQSSLRTMRTDFIQVKTGDSIVYKNMNGMSSSWNILSFYTGEAQGYYTSGIAGQTTPQSGVWTAQQDGYIRLFGSFPAGDKISVTMTDLAPDVEDYLSQYSAMNYRFLPNSIPKIVAHIQEYLSNHPIADSTTLQAVIDAAFKSYLEEIQETADTYIAEAVPPAAAAAVDAAASPALAEITAKTAEAAESARQAGLSQQSAEMSEENALTYRNQAQQIKDSITAEVSASVLAAQEQATLAQESAQAADQSADTAEQYVAQARAQAAAAAAQAQTASGYASDAQGYMQDAAHSAATFSTDPTLTISGKAADAKATGDQLIDLKSALQSTWGSVLLASLPVIDSSSNWYKSVQNALENIEYDFVITAQTAGTYLFQIGIGASASSMRLDVGSFTFEAGETKTITYTPVGSQLKYFRFYSESVPLQNTVWTLAIQNTITAKEIKDTQVNVTEINTLIGCEYLPTVKGEWYDTSGTTVDITSPNSNQGWNSAVVPCAENDVFTITGTGGSSPRLWAFAASDGTIISHQDSAVTSSTVTDYILYAPANSAYFIVNFTNSAPFRLLKGLTLDYKFSIEDYEDRITTKHKVIVDANGSGDYTTIQAAINNITDSSFTNQYEIVLMDGTYTEQNLILPAYTYLHGVGQVSPVITSVGLSEYVSVIDAQNTCRIANVKVISGTKYCLHEDVKLSNCTVICENVEFEQMGTMNQTVIGNGVFENAKFVFTGCTFKGGNVFSHTNSNSFIGITQHLEFEYCKFNNAGIVLSVSGSVDSNNMAECICKIVGCKGDGVTPLLTCRVPTDNVYPWKVIGGSNINFSVVYDGETLTGVVNTTDN